MNGQEEIFQVNIKLANSAASENFPMHKILVFGQ